MPENSNPLNKYFRQPAIFVTLPSGGNYPPHILIPSQTGEIGVQPMTARDEIIFKTPLNYREPPPKLISNGNGFNLQHTKSPEKDQQSSGSSTNPTKKKKKFVPFSGKGHRLGGD